MGCRTFLASSLAAAVAAVAFSSTASADLFPVFGKVALTGETAPGTADLDYQGFEQPTINATGQVAWYGAYGPDSTTLSNAIWTTALTGPGDGTFMVASVGALAPGTSLNYEGFGGARVGLSDTGALVFTGTLNDDAAPDANTDRAIWTGIVDANGSTIQLLVREGDDVPLGGASFDDPPFNGSQPVFNNNLGLAVIGKGGIAGFSSPMTNDVDNSLNEHSLFGGTPGSVEPIALAGTQVFNDTAGVLYAGAATTPRLNTFGASAFAAGLKGNETGTAIFVGAPGNAQVLAAQGRAAPGFAGSETFDAIQFPDLNDDGQVAFVAAVNGFQTDTNPFLGEAIYFGDATNGISPVVLIGDTVSGSADTYKEFVNAFGPMINDAGQITFVAIIDTGGGDELAIMVGDASDPANLQIAAREGVTLYQGGGVFPTGVSLNDSPLINNAGDVAFHISESGGATSLWLAHNSGELVRIVGSGDQFTVADGDIRQVLALKMGSNIDGYQYLSDNGSIVFGLLFTDGSQGVFTSNVVIPEPAGVALALAAGGLLLRRRRA